MKKIVYYISDHGFGHATRSIAIIDALLRNIPNIEIIVRTSKSASLLQESFNVTRLKVAVQQNDFGFVTDPATLSVDVEKTRERLASWIATWSQYTAIERKFLSDERVVLVLSDIVPQPFLVAHDLGISAIGISNFTWYDVYKEFFPDTELIERIKNCYELGEQAFVLPMELPMEGFMKQQKISLVSRALTHDLSRYRKQEFDYQVYYGTGQSVNPHLIDIEGLKDKNICLIVSSNSPLKEQENIFKMDSSTTQSQNIIGASDLVITKPGYGTVSEAIRGGRPLGLFMSDLSAESKAITQSVLDLDVGTEISFDDLLSGNWMENIEQLIDVKKNYSHLPARFQKDGCNEIVRLIGEII